MKRKNLLYLAVGALCGALAVLLPQLAGEGELTVLAEEKLIPAATVAAAAVMSAYVALLPVIRLVRAAAARFTDAADGVERTARGGEDAAAAFRACTAALRESESELAACRQNTEDLLRLSRTGFCNMNELVEKGYAREIAEIGARHDG